MWAIFMWKCDDVGKKNLVKTTMLLFIAIDKLTL